MEILFFLCPIKTITEEVTCSNSSSSAISLPGKHHSSKDMPIGGKHALLFVLFYFLLFLFSVTLLLFAFFVLFHHSLEMCSGRAEGKVFVFSSLAVICLRSGDKSQRQKYTIVNFSQQGIITSVLCIHKRFPKAHYSAK